MGGDRPSPPHARSPPGAAGARSALTHPNHANLEIAHQRPHDGPETRFRDLSPPATSTRSTPQPDFSVQQPVMIGLPANRRLSRTGTGWRSGSGREGGNAASSRGAEERGGALSQVVVPGWIEVADEVSPSLSSLARREARLHFSAGDSDYDHRKRDDRLTTA
jgi:hypothetical protein